MTLVQRVLSEATSGVSVTDTPEGLRAIHRPDCAATIWRRQALPSFLAWINTLAPALLPKTRLILRPHDARAAVAQICANFYTPDCPERDMLIDDVAALANIFAGVMGAPYLRLRLYPVTTNACRRFHIDAVTARLVCTYRGTGTQYGLSPDGEEPSRVFTVPTGAPLVLRGTLWPEQPRSGLLHRSPPIEGTGETRLVLVLDPVGDPDDEPEEMFLH